MSFFVGIAFDEPTRGEIARALTAPNMKWEREEKLHLTLFFYGAAPPRDGLIDEVAARHAAFTLRVKGSGTFDDRILWLGVEGELEKLRALQAEFGKEERGYTPHITVARAKKGRVPHLLQEFEGTAFRVARISLFESRGGQYLVLSSADLRG